MNSPANDWAALDRAPSDLAASGSVEVREDGEWLAELATLHFELRVERKNPLVHLWSDERNLTRRVLRVKENAGDRIVLEVQRFGRAKRGAIEGLRFFVPQGISQRLRERLLAFSASLRAEIYEMREPDAAMQKIDPADAGNLESWLVPRDQLESVLRAASETITRIRAMLPSNADAIQCRAPAAANEVALTFHGMQFARWTRQGVFFGLGNSTEMLTTSNERALERLLHQLDLHRSPLATDANHALYRGAPERWLESIVLEDPAKLDALLDTRHFYSQVPALAAGDRGVLDLLGITRQGRLVVIELKASEDLQLPVQAVDYWLRVRRHQREGDFQRDGYFAGVAIDPQPPLVWLVSPGLRFHSATDTLLKYLSPEIHITRIGLAENWRRGLKIIFRQ
ncbi:MAG TPA: hypothetical protein VIH88_01710 [Candidatus Acidoferrales bacterium]